jgi:hypothetical protein
MPFVQMLSQSHRRKGLLFRITLVAAAAVGLLVAFAGPAQAGSASISHQ